MKFAIALALVVCGCTSPDGPESDPDLDADPDLQAIASDDMAEDPAADPDSSELALAARVACTKHRFLHVANYSFVAPAGMNYCTTH